VPGLDEIRATWNSDAGWSAGGDEWSGAWGGTEPLWWGTLMPRIHAFVPAGTILEVGPGQGRWSQYLADLCDQLVLVDVAERCIDACRARLASATNVSYHVGDGRTLPMVADRSIDFAFSFDSLVHAEADVMDGYAHELARTLAPEGVAFLHHSNMGEHARAAALARRVPDRLRRKLVARGALVNTYGWRAESATAGLFAEQCERAGLACVSQELIAWQYGRWLTDAISVVTRPGSRWDRPRTTVRNRRFMDEARVARRRHAAALRSAAGAGPS
jgi:SAM-dependent methyltransferase